MAEVPECRSLDEIRGQIDRIDRGIVSLIAERGIHVRQAARFKVTPADVRAPDRVAQVLAKADALARELTADPAVVAAVYRAMVGAFIQAELAEHATLGRGADAELPAAPPPADE